MTENNLPKYINALAAEFKKNSIDDYEYLPKNKQLFFLYAYYHFFNADISQLDEILALDVADNQATDKVGGLYADYDGDEDKKLLIAVIPLYLQGKKDLPKVQALQTIYLDAKNAILDAAAGKQTARAPLCTFLKTEEFDGFKNNILQINLITNVTPASTKVKEIEKLLEKLNADESKSVRDGAPITFKITYGRDIESEVLEAEDPKECVDEDTLKIDRPDNALRYGDEGSIIVNISALSLKGLYERHGYRGLFGQNLRLYLTDKPVDNAIRTTIEEYPDNFWYYSNGIFIITDDFTLTGDTLHLKKFSIVNGGQTSNLIGRADITHDFFLSCKVVKNKYPTETERLQFITDVATASNTQKPIKAWDLVAGKPEQKLLKRYLLEAGVFCSVKRGEFPRKKAYKEAWRVTNNEDLGQLLLASLYQCPGTARSQKKKICLKTSLYNIIFGKISESHMYNTEMLCDLLRFRIQYNKWKRHLARPDSMTDGTKIRLANNGQFFMAAAIGLFAKLYSRPYLVSQLKQTTSFPAKDELCSHYDISHPIFNQELFADGSEDSLFPLFEILCDRYILRGWNLFQNGATDAQKNACSNFTKTDHNYKTSIAPLVRDVFEWPEGIPLIERFFYHPTASERERDNDLVREFANTPTPRQATEQQAKANRLLTALKNYRMQMKRERGIPVAQIIPTKAITKISQAMPETLEALRALNCLDSFQFINYGESIVQTVKETLAEFDEVKKRENERALQEASSQS